MTKLQLTGNVKFYIRFLSAGSELSASLKTGELVINGNATPFVLKEINYKGGGKMRSEFETFFNVFSFVEQREDDIFIRNGYRSFRISNLQGSLRVYIKEEFLKDFFLAICLGSI